MPDWQGNITQEDVIQVIGCILFLVLVCSPFWIAAVFF